MNASEEMGRRRSGRGTDAAYTRVDCFGCAGPVMKPSWFSFDSSSSVFCFVSGMSSVEKIPVNMKNAKISRLSCSASASYSIVRGLEATHAFSSYIHVGGPNTHSSVSGSCCKTGSCSIQ